jgi:hypothetical protein
MINSRIKIGSIALSAMILAACGGSNNTEVVEDAQFNITTTNLTNAQIMSPVAVIMHNSGYHNFIDGESASLAVETLAEGGDNAPLLEAAATAEQYIASGSAGPVLPSAVGATLTLDVPADQLSDLRLSVMSMLIRTNDAFTGLNAIDISNMEVGSSRTFTAPTWDAGTELDDEVGVNMPGAGGEGFNATRNDRIDLVRFHNGVVTSSSPEFGLPTSDLVEADRFLNPTSRIVVTRTR